MINNSAITVELKANPENNNVDNYGVIHDLYQRYGSRLLGYITEVVKDSNLAEQYLIAVFKEVLNKVEEVSLADNPWIKLQRLAKSVLSSFNQAVLPHSFPAKSNGSTIINSYMKLMNVEQQEVFCGIHYQQKNTAILAKELNKTENAVKQLLREALIIIRNEQKH